MRPALEVDFGLPWTSSTFEELYFNDLIWQKQSIYLIDKTKSELVETDMNTHERKQELGATAFPSIALSCLSFHKWSVHSIAGFTGPV